MTTLRPYQERDIGVLRDALRAGFKRPVFQASVAYGKTVLSAEIIKMATARGHRAIFTVPQTILIDQTVRSFYNRGIDDIGVIQANHPLTNYARGVQVCSVQTLARRKPPPAGIVIVDEAHLCFQSVYRWMNDPEWRDVPFIGLSATPWARGMGKYWDNLIVGETIESLTDQGYLSPLRYCRPDVPDLDGIKMVAGDYHEGQLSARMRGKEILANSVDKWVDMGEGRPTIAFCVDRAHAQDMQSRFIECGIPCGYIDANTLPEEREVIGKKLEDGRLKVVTSVGCLIVGLDWTFVSCVLHARPTKSRMLYIQSIGRGLRLHPGKEDCLVLDVAGNYKLGHPYDIKYDKLDDGTPASREERQIREENIPEAKACQSCGNMKPPRVKVCPTCGFQSQKQTEVVEGNADLVEVERSGAKKKKKRRTPADFTKEERQSWFSDLMCVQGERNYNEKWAAVQYKEKFDCWPSADGLNEVQSHDASPQVRSWVKHRMIRWAKSKDKGTRKVANG